MAVEKSGGVASRRQNTLIQQVRELQARIAAAQAAATHKPIRTTGRNKHTVAPTVLTLPPANPTVYTSPQEDTSPVTAPIPSRAQPPWGPSHLLTALRLRRRLAQLDPTANENPPQYHLRRRLRRP
jgi:hypothetical protein